MGAGKREFLMSQVKNLGARLQQHRLWEIVRTWVDWMWEDVKKEESRVFLSIFFFSGASGWKEVPWGNGEGMRQAKVGDKLYKNHQHKYGI